MTLSLSQVLPGSSFAHGQALGAALVHQTTGGPVIYTASGSGGSVTGFSVASDGTLSVLDSWTHPLFLAAGATPRLALAPTPTGPVLYVAGIDPASGAALRLAPDGSFDGTTPLALPTAPLQGQGVAGVGGNTWLFSALTGGGIGAFAPGPDGALGAGPVLPPGDDPGLQDIAAIAPVPGGILAISETGGTVLRFAVAPDGTLTETARLGTADGLGLTLPRTLEVVDLGGATYAIAGSAGTGALTVLAVEPGGALSLADHIVDNLPTRFDGAGALAVAKVGGAVFVAAGGLDDGISLFTLLPGGRLVLLDTIVDGTATTLSDVGALALVATGTGLHIVAGGIEDGVTRLTYDISGLGGVLSGLPSGGPLFGTAEDDTLAGGHGADAITGAGGDDILSDGEGSDTLTGGSGADLFVLDADGTPDRITDFDVAEDRLDLSAWRFLYAASQLAVTPTSDGAILRHRDEELEIVTSAGTPLSALDVTGWDVVPLDRPLFVPADQVLQGGSGSDTLTGGLGQDTITGGTGQDLISGGAGDDELSGDAGFDTLYGGAGDDHLLGGAQADSLFGGDGNDRIDGGDGLDTAEGEAGADTIIGGAGNDILRGGAGDDRVEGGINEDRLWGDDGADLLFGDAGFDSLDGGAGDDTLFGGAQADNLWGRLGNDVIHGDGGFDRLFGGAGADVLSGGAGPDALFGEDGDDLLDGGADDDRLNGGPGNDVVDGGTGQDEIAGGAGFDTLLGGIGDDTLTGNFNADLFVFADGFGTDRITDFAATNAFEKIDLQAVGAITDWDDLSTVHMVQAGPDVRITAGPDVLILLGVSLSDIGPDDFVF